jgi:large subunit ribosomal protein L3
VHVVQAKTVATDGYAPCSSASATEAAARTKAYRTHCAQVGQGRLPVLREFRLEDSARFAPATSSPSTALQAGDRDRRHRHQQGRGYTGVIKRHGFSGFPRSHGTHEYFRHGGSIGNRSYPAACSRASAWPALRHRPRDHPEHRSDRRPPARHLLLVRGAVPGPRGVVLCIRR